MLEGGVVSAIDKHSPRGVTIDQRLLQWKPVLNTGLVTHLSLRTNQNIFDEQLTPNR